MDHWVQILCVFTMQRARSTRKMQQGAPFDLHSKSYVQGQSVVRLHRQKLETRRPLLPTSSRAFDLRAGPEENPLRQFHRSALKALSFPCRSHREEQYTMPVIVVSMQSTIGWKSPQCDADSDAHAVALSAPPKRVSLSANPLALRGAQRSLRDQAVQAGI